MLGRSSLTLALSLLAASACAASVGGGKSDAGRSRANECSAPLEKATVRRLSQVEYNRTVRDLLGALDVPEQGLVVDLPVHGFENAASSLNPSALLLERYQDAASSIGVLAGGSLGTVLPCAARSRDLSCGRRLITDFGMRAFRRPLTAEERARYEAFFAKQLSDISFRGAVELTVQALLQAPQFLYRIEQGAAGQPLTDYEAASRLSYFLWQSMPDDQLFTAAARGALRTREQVTAQARRMLGDERATETVVDFHRQWLSFDRVMAENKDFMLFPRWNDTLRAAMREESDRFVAHTFESGSNMLAELLTSRTTFVNEPLAQYYGVASHGGDWQMTALPQAERSGILTRGSFLAGFAHSTNGSPPLRGVAVLEKLLCAGPPPPPASADTSTPKNTGPAPRTNRDLFAERTSAKGCGACHAEIDGIGFGFERYDAMGSYRTTDNGLPVDASGALLHTEDIDGAFDGAIQLSSKLAGSKQVKACMVMNWFRFAFGREPTRDDRCVLDQYNAALDAHHGDLRELLVAIASSDAFMSRASEAR